MIEYAAQDVLLNDAISKNSNIKSILEDKLESIKDLIEEKEHSLLASCLSSFDLEIAKSE